MAKIRFLQHFYGSIILCCLLCLPHTAKPSGVRPEFKSYFKSLKWSYGPSTRFGVRFSYVCSFAQVAAVFPIFPDFSSIGFGGGQNDCKKNIVCLAPKRNFLVEMSHCSFICYLCLLLLDDQTEICLVFWLQIRQRRRRRPIVYLRWRLKEKKPKRFRSRSRKQSYGQFKYRCYKYFYDLYFDPALTSKIFFLMNHFFQSVWKKGWVVQMNK